MTVHREFVAIAITVALLVQPVAAQAQGTSLRPYPELRIDALAGRPHALQLGAGVVFPLGNYARLGAVAAGGVASDGETMGSARADVIMRFLLDPFREQRLAVSAGGGVSARYEEGAGWRPFLVVVLDLEGRKMGPLSPALQIGLGGGARVGLVLRGSRSSR